MTLEGDKAKIYNDIELLKSMHIFLKGDDDVSYFLFLNFINL